MSGAPPISSMVAGIWRTAGVRGDVASVDRGVRAISSVAAMAHGAMKDGGGPGAMLSR